MRWGLEYEWRNVEDATAYGSTSTIYVTHSVGSLAKGHRIAPFAVLTDTTKTLSSILVCRLFRNSSDTVNDTYTGSIYLLSIDVHVEIDALGSKDEYTK